MASVYRRRYWCTTADGKRERRVQDFYTVEYRDPATRKIVRLRGPTDRKAALKMAHDLFAARERGEVDLLDKFKGQRNRPINEHVAEYLADLEARGCDDKYRENVGHRLRRLVAECGWSTLAGVRAADFVAWRSRQRGKSAGTVNQWQETASTFLNWCVRPGRRIGENPLRDLEKVEGEEVRKRRAASDEELAWLLAVAPEGRRLVWETLLTTGLRVQELTDLEWSNLSLDGEAPFLALRKMQAKSREEQVLPLRADLAGRLAALRPEDAKPTDRVFRDVPSIRDWRQDLEAARRAWVEAAEGEQERAKRAASDFLRYMDGCGRRFDRHACRMTLASRLQASGVPLRLASEVLRHSDIRLTQRCYTDPRAFSLRPVVEGLPAVRPVVLAREVARQTLPETCGQGGTEAGGNERGNARKVGGDKGVA